MDEIEIDAIVMQEECFPVYASLLAAGADVKAHLSEEVVLAPGESQLIPTGVFIAIPEGFEIQVRPRSGLALKHQVTVLNTPGTIDADYRGEIKVLLINHGKQSFIVTPGMRIAQLVLSRVTKMRFVKKETLEQTARGACGFGHTGTH